MIEMMSENTRTAHPQHIWQTHIKVLSRVLASHMSESKMPFATFWLGLSAVSSLGMQVTKLQIRAGWLSASSQVPAACNQFW